MANLSKGANKVASTVCGKSLIHRKRLFWLIVVLWKASIVISAPAMDSVYVRNAISYALPDALGEDLVQKVLIHGYAIHINHRTINFPSKQRLM